MHCGCHVKRYLYLALIYFCSSRRWLVTSAQINIHFEYRHELEDLAEEHPELLVLGRCSEEANSENATMRCRGGDNYLYPDIYQVCHSYIFLCK